MLQDVSTIISICNISIKYFEKVSLAGTKLLKKSVFDSCIKKLSAMAERQHIFVSLLNPQTPATSVSSPTDGDDPLKPEQG